MSFDYDLPAVALTIHVGYKLVSLAGHRHQEARLVFSLSQHFSQSRDLNGKIGFLDDLALPNRVQDLVFRNYVSVLLDQESKQIECLGVQREWFAVAPKLPMLSI